MIRTFRTANLAGAAVGTAFLLVAAGAEGKAGPTVKSPAPKFTEAVAHAMAPPRLSHGPLVSWHGEPICAEARTMDRVW